MNALELIFLLIENLSRRKFKPQDILKLMFTFKNLGSYTTDNLRKIIMENN